jgi:hypothetical protein
MLVPVLLVGMLLAGCAQNRDNPPGKTATTAPAADGSKYLLGQEPAGAANVKELRAKAKDGDDVVLVGRIGGNAEPWIKGRAGFWVVDTSLVPCNERPDDPCETPWDYCCEPPDAKAKGMATVKIVDDQGKTLPTDARELLKLKELDTVVVRGRAKRDAEGNLVVLASGIYRRPPAK